MDKQHTGSDRGGENGLPKDTLGSTEGSAMKGLTGLEMKGSWRGQDLVYVGSKPSRQSGCTDHITNKHVEEKCLQLQKRKYEVTEVTTRKR